MEDSPKVKPTNFAKLRLANVVLSDICRTPALKRATIAKRYMSTRAGGEKSNSGSSSLVNRVDKIQIRDRG